MHKSKEERLVYKKLNSADADAETPKEAPPCRICITSDCVHKKTISYCVKDGSGRMHSEGAIPATRFDLDR
jgi:hypothetical protein